LFVDPAPGPVLANYGLESLRFVKPVYIGDTIQAKPTCKQKTAKETPPDGVPQGVVAWDVEVTNQANETVAVYTILTLVRRLSSAGLGSNGAGNGAAPSDGKVDAEVADPGPGAAKVGESQPERAKLARADRSLNSHDPHAHVVRQWQVTAVA